METPPASPASPKFVSPTFSSKLSPSSTELSNDMEVRRASGAAGCSVVGVGVSAGGGIGVGVSETASAGGSAVGAGVVVGGSDTIIGVGSASRDCSDRR